eukprot:755040-Hanusia_phi.AAC.5
MQACNAFRSTHAQKLFMKGSKKSIQQIVSQTYHPYPCSDDTRQTGVEDTGHWSPGWLLGEVRDHLSDDQ